MKILLVEDNVELGQSLAELRALNDTSLPPDRTEHIRGRIAQLKALLALADEPKPPPT